MPRYTEEQIEQVRSANDIVDVIGASVRLKRSRSEEHTSELQST